ncbi:hypothetical protein [Mesorhizobium australicum]|uniref:hypothetical protein n=1 Tax=Mesorhizobium australicum TaxID=536018 RepID=UPI00333B09D0
MAKWHREAAGQYIKRYELEERVGGLPADTRTRGRSADMIFAVDMREAQRLIIEMDRWLKARAAETTVH